MGPQVFVSDHFSGLAGFSNCALASSKTFASISLRSSFSLVRFIAAVFASAGLFSKKRSSASEESYSLPAAFTLGTKLNEIYVSSSALPCVRSISFITLTPVLAGSCMLLNACLIIVLFSSVIDTRSAMVAMPASSMA